MIDRSEGDELPDSFTSVDDMHGGPSSVDADLFDGMNTTVEDHQSVHTERWPWAAIGLVIVGGAFAIGAISVRQAWVNFASGACLAMAWSQARPQVLDDGSRIGHPLIEASSRKLIGVFAVLMAVLGLMEMVRG